MSDSARLNSSVGRVRRNPHCSKVNANVSTRSANLAKSVTARRAKPTASWLASEKFVFLSEPGSQR